MKIEKDLKPRLEFDPDKVSDAYEKIVTIFQESKLTVGEILILYGNLGYTLGASIQGYTEKGPDIEELKKQYYTNPGPGIALMLQGIEVTSWYEDWERVKLGIQGTEEKS